LTEFAETALRTYCRNPKCRSRLKAPVGNPREAFCARGCHSSFYLKRCLVCEGPLERKRDDQKVCRNSKCRSAFRGGFEGGRYPPSAKLAAKTLDFIDSKQPLKRDPRSLSWRVVAGPPEGISANAYHCA